MVAADAIVATLDARGYRITEPRRQVAMLIAGFDGHFTADELLASAQRQRLQVGRATIFRSLDLLGRIDAVERVDLPNGDHAFVACEPSHHHHVVCSRCGRTSAVPEAELGELTAAIGEVGRRTGYRIDSHRVELFGTCPSCLRGTGS